MDFKEVRAKFPQYDDLPDDVLAGKIHQKFYADIPFDEFAQKVGYQSQPTQEAPAAPQTAMDQVRGAGDKWSQMLSNIGPSATNAVRDYVVGPLTHPLKTLESMGQFPIGLFNKVAPEGLQIPGQGAADETVNAMGQRVADRYGSMDKATNTMVTDPVGAIAEIAMAAFGARGIGRAAKGGIAKAAEMAPEAVKGEADAWSQSLYRKAISPPTRKSLSEAQIEQGLKTGLEKKFVPNKKSLTTLGDDINSLNNKISGWFKESGEAPKLIPVDSVVSRLKGLREEFIHDEKALGQITQVENMLRKPNKDFAGRLVTQDGKSFIPSDVAHDMKRALYKQLGSRPYGVVDTLPEVTLAKRALAAALKEEVAAAHPDLASLNTVDSKLIRLQEIAEPRIRRELNNQWWSLSGKAAMALGHGVAGKWGMVAGMALDSLNRSPSIQARSAILMDKFAKAGVKADQAAVNEILAQMPSKIGFPDIAKMDEMLAARAAEPQRAAAEQAAWKADKLAREATAVEAEAKNTAELAAIARERSAINGPQTPEAIRAAREQEAWSAKRESRLVPGMPVESDPIQGRPMIRRATVDAINRNELSALSREREGLISRPSAEPEIVFSELRALYKQVFKKEPDPFMNPSRMRELINRELNK